MITGIVICKNEEDNIVDSVESLNFCDQIVVVDDYSTDRTIELLNNLKKEHKRLDILSSYLNSDFSKQRNFAMSKAKNEWVLFLDADERVPEALRNEILGVIRKREISGLYIKRDDFMWGDRLKHGDVSNVWILRLARKSAGKWEGKVHERWVVEGNTAKLKNPIEHNPHRNLTEFLTEINNYTNIRAQELYDNGKKVNAFSIIAYPKAKFLLNYIFKLGFLDGEKGFMLAMLMSFHSFLVRAKLWKLWQKK